VTARPAPRRIAGHEIVEIRKADVTLSYDRLVLRDQKGRTIWTVLLCEPADSGWAVTAIRYRRGMPRLNTIASPNPRLQRTGYLQRSTGSPLRRRPSGR
jgi:hypothetical protein